MSTKLDKATFVERVTAWLMRDDKPDRALPVEARASFGLDGVYDGESAHIRRLVTLAYLRGIRRGAACAWEAQQPIVLRDTETKPCP